MHDEERAHRQTRLTQASIVAAECRKCAIGYERRNNVYGEGDPCARLMVVGEGPGETEDELGRPFVGRAGQLLDRMLAAIGLPREDVYICNTVKCRATIPGPNGPRNRAPDQQEMENCRAFWTNKSKSSHRKSSWHSARRPRGRFSGVISPSPECVGAGTSARAIYR